MTPLFWHHTCPTHHRRSHEGLWALKILIKHILLFRVILSCMIPDLNMIGTEDSVSSKQFQWPVNKANSNWDGDIFVWTIGCRESLARNVFQWRIYAETETGIEWYASCSSSCGNWVRLSQSNKIKAQNYHKCCQLQYGSDHRMKDALITCCEAVKKIKKNTCKASQWSV